MATVFLDPGGDADFGTGLLISPTLGTTAVTASSTQVHGFHQRSYLASNASGSSYAELTAGLSTSGGRFSVYIYITAYPSALGTILILTQTGLGAAVLEIKMNTDGTLQLWNSATAQIGVSTRAIPLNTWTRLSLAYSITSTTVNSFGVWLDGALQTNPSNATLTNISPVDLLFGNAGGNAEQFYFSDIYIDNTTSITDPGNIWVTAKRPYSNGTANGFTTQVGSGGSGYGSGHAPQVNERALSTTNGWSLATSSAITEEYTIEPANTGDYDISNLAIIDSMGWIEAASTLAETSKIVLAGASTNISTTSTATVFRQIAGSTAYPLGGTDIGMISAAVNTTYSLYEAGVVFAFIPVRPPAEPLQFANRLVGPNSKRYTNKRPPYFAPTQTNQQPFQPWTGPFGVIPANSPRPKHDDFNENYLDPTIWKTTDANDATQIHVQNNRLEITHSTGPQYNGPSTNDLYDFTGQATVIQILDAGNQTLVSHEAQLQVYRDGSNAIWLTASGGNLSAFKLVGGTQTQIGASVTFNIITHAWWRIREQGGTLFFDTSPDPSNGWTNRWSLANPFAVTALTIFPKSGCWQVEASGSFAYFDNFYLPDYQNDVQNFITDAGRSPNYIGIYQQWGSTGGFQNFLNGWMDSIYAMGATPMITWEPWVGGGGTSQPTYSLANIIAGNFDTYIQAFATAAAAWGRTFYMRYAHEMNGNWYPWSEQVNGNSAGQYATAWQHVYNTFTAICTNAIWVWCPNTEYNGSTALSGLYPGDSYVGWTGIDIYNWNLVNGSGAVWNSFTNLITQTYNDILAITSKPMMIGEVSSVDAGGTKSDWITNTLTYEIYKFPQIQTWFWFNNNNNPDWRIESNANAQAAFKAAIQSEPAITYGPIRIANRKVGPMSLRYNFKQPYVPSSAAATVVALTLGWIQPPSQPTNHFRVKIEDV